MTIGSQDGPTAVGRNDGRSGGPSRSGRAAALTCAAASALCGLSCLLLAGGSLVLLMMRHWTTGLVLLAASVAATVLSKLLDRAKMRVLYGRKLGTLLHASDGEAQAADLARRDLTRYQAMQDAAEATGTRPDRLHRAAGNCG